MVAVRVRSSPAASMLLVFLMGCGVDEEQGGRRAHAGLRLIPVDSVRLAEADTLYLGNPFSLTADPYDGSFYVSDFFADRVFRFDRDGSLRMRYGRPGSGPGEFTTPGVAWALDSVNLAAVESDRGVIHVFDRTSGVFRRSVPFEGILGSTVPIRTGSVYWLASRNRGRSTSVMTWDTHSDSIRFVLPLPQEYMRSFEGIGRFAAFRSRGTMTAWGDTLLVGMRGLNYLLVASPDGAVLDTLHVPVTHRRGVPANVVNIVDERVPKIDPHLVSSALDHLHRRPDGSFILVHHDSQREGEGPSELITARVFVSMVSADRTRACVDAELPVSQDARPIHGFRGDTLLLLDRRLRGEEVQTWIVSYLVDADGCEWLPTRR